VARVGTRWGAATGMQGGLKIDVGEKGARR
jgi:hypothetical protein